MSEKRLLIDRNHAIPIIRQAELLGISRASAYALPVPPSLEDLLLYAAIDRLYTAHPYYGTRRLAYVLKRDEGIAAGRKRIRSAMRVLGLEALYPKRNTSKPDNRNRIYPYLLKDVVANYPNHIWGTDITYIRLTNGFCYLVAILDWYSRYVVHWELSATLEIPFCIENINRALAVGIPDTHNSDQGSHFTSPQYTQPLIEHGVRISMDGRGRCMDNIFTERLWRTVKYEDVYLKGYTTIEEARAGLTAYFLFYNTDRPHQSLGYRTPASAYFANTNTNKHAVLMGSLPPITV